MTPDEAAAVLGIGRDADVTDIDRAYRRLARELHPDRYVGAPASAVRAASDRFIDVTRARDVLMGVAAARTRAAAGAGTGAGTGAGHGHGMGASAATPPPRVPGGPRTVEEAAAGGAASARPLGPFSWWLFGAWTLLLVVGALLSFSAGPLWAPIDLWARIVLLVVFALATALTARRWVWRVTLLLIAVGAAATVAQTTVGGLLGLGFMIVASFGLAVQARLVRFPD